MDLDRATLISEMSEGLLKSAALEIEPSITEEAPGEYVVTLPCADWGTSHIDYFLCLRFLFQHMDDVSIYYDKDSSEIRISESLPADYVFKGDPDAEVERPEQIVLYPREQGGYFRSIKARKMFCDNDRCLLVLTCPLALSFELACRDLVLSTIGKFELFGLSTIANDSLPEGLVKQDIKLLILEAKELSLIEAIFNVH